MAYFFPLCLRWVDEIVEELKKEGEKMVVFYTLRRRTRFVLVCVWACVMFSGGGPFCVSAQNVREEVSFLDPSLRPKTTTLRQAF